MAGGQQELLVCCLPARQWVQPRATLRTWVPGENLGALVFAALPGVGTGCADPSADEFGSLGQLRLLLCLRAFFSLLPSQSLCDFCNLIFGAPLKIFKPFAMIAVPQQLLFSCERAVAVTSWLGFDLHCHQGCRASAGLLHGPGTSLKER